MCSPHPFTTKLLWGTHPNYYSKPRHQWTTMQQCTFTAPNVVTLSPCQQRDSTCSPTPSRYTPCYLHYGFPSLNNATLLTPGIMSMISWQHICQIPTQAEHHLGFAHHLVRPTTTFSVGPHTPRTATSWFQSIHPNSSFGLTLQMASLCQRALPKTSTSCQIPQPCRTPHCHLRLEDTTQTTIESTHQHSLDKNITPCGDRPHTPAYKRDEASHTSPLTHSGIDPSRATLCMHHTSPVCKTHPHTPIIRHLQA